MHCALPRAAATLQVFLFSFSVYPECVVLCSKPVPPKIIVPQNGNVFVVNQTDDLELECIVESFPMATVTFYGGNNIVTRTHEGTIMTNESSVYSKYALNVWSVRIQFSSLVSMPWDNHLKAFLMICSPK